MGPAQGDHGWISPIQIYENVSAISLRRIGLEVYVTAFPITQAEKSGRWRAVSVGQRSTAVLREMPCGFGRESGGSD